MPRTAQLTKSMQVRFDEETYARIVAVCDAAQIWNSDFIRACVAASLTSAELQNGIVTVDDLEDEELARLGITRPVEKPAASRAAGAAWGPPAG